MRNCICNCVNPNYPMFYAPPSIRSPRSSAILERPFCVTVVPELLISVCADVDLKTLTGTVELRIAGLPVAHGVIGPGQLTVGLGGTAYGVTVKLDLTLNPQTLCWTAKGQAGFLKFIYTIDFDLGCTPHGSGFGGSIADLTNAVILNPTRDVLPDKQYTNYPLYGYNWTLHGLVQTSANTFCGQISHSVPAADDQIYYCIGIKNNPADNNRPYLNYVSNDPGQKTSKSMSNGLFNYNAQMIVNMASRQNEPAFSTWQQAATVILNSIAVDLAAKNGYGTATPPIPAAAQASWNRPY